MTVFAFVGSLTPCASSFVSRPSAERVCGRRLLRTSGFVFPPSRGSTVLHRHVQPKTRENPTAMLSSSNGVSNQADTAAAVKEAVEVAKRSLPDCAKPTLCVIAATPERDVNEVAECFRKELQQVPFIGATSCVNVLTPVGPVENGVSATLLAAEPNTFLAASAAFSDGVSPYEAGKKAALDIKEKAIADIKAVYLSATPGNEEDVLRGVHEVLGENIPVVGGSAADNDVSGKWAVFHDGRAIPSGVVMFAVTGSSVKAGASLASPYNPTEHKFKVTKADGRTVHSLENRPAADILYDIVGDAIAEEFKNGGMILGPMSTRPMSLRRSMKDGSETYLAVHAAAINQPEKSISLFVEAQVGDELTVMDNDGGGDSARAAGIGINNAYSTAKRNGNMVAPSCSFLVYCGGLSMAVGDRLAETLTQAYAKVAPDCSTGITAFGEQGPLASAAGNTPMNNHCNLSVSMLLLE